LSRKITSVVRGGGGASAVLHPEPAVKPIRRGAHRVAEISRLDLFMGV